MENTGFKVSSVFFILYIYRMKKIMKEKNAEFNLQMQQNSD